MTQIVAHRSGPSDYPEQTVEAALDSLKKGADIVEVDVRLSSDGKLVISHDGNLKRIFGVDKRAEELTQEEFLSLKREGGYHGLTLEDYIGAGALPLLVHVKVDGALTPVLELAREKGVEDKIIIGAHNVPMVRKTKAFNPGIKVLAFMKTPVYTGRFIDAGADCIRLWEGWYTRRKRDYIHSRNVRLAIMTGGIPGYDVGYTTDEKLAFFANEGVDAILINEVERLTRR